MKSNIFRQIVDEAVVDIETDWQTAVERMREQCEPNNQYSIVRCSEWGKISAQSRYGRYSVVGEIVFEEGKTKAKIYTVYDRWVMLMRYAATVIDLLLLAIFVPILYITNNGLSLGEILIALAMAGIGVYNTMTELYRDKNTPTSVLSRKNLAITMLKNIDLWDK